MMKETVNLVFTCGGKSVYIDIRAGEGKLEVYIQDNSMGYGQSSVTDAFEYMKIHYPNYKLTSVRTNLQGTFEFKPND